jgi:hypothetical protein
MLAHLYFPKLEEPFTEYYAALLDLYHFLLSFAPLVAGPASVMGMAVTKVALFPQHDARIDKAREAVQREIAAQAKRLL